MPTPRTHILAACILASGIALAGYAVGSSFTAMKNADRFVTVRGLNERDVEADLATWSLKYRSTNDDLQLAYGQLEVQKQAVIDFLKKNGLKESEMTLVPIKVTDRQSQDYNNNTGGARYVLQGGINLRTEKVKDMFDLSQQTQALIQSGVTLVDENYCGNMPRFSFTKLNEVKPEMLKDATRNAREAAQQFATDSGANVGSIRRASQGYFSISGRDSGGEASGSSECGDDASIMKKLRVVTTIDYFLE